MRGVLAAYFKSKLMILTFNKEEIEKQLKILTKSIKVYKIMKPTKKNKKLKIQKKFTRMKASMTHKKKLNKNLMYPKNIFLSINFTKNNVLSTNNSH